VSSACRFRSRRTRSMPATVRCCPR
jgi:hypothetical protein